MKAESILLEPYYAFAIDAPQACMGRVLSDIQRMSGTFDPPETDGERATVRGPRAGFGDDGLCAGPGRP